MISLSLLDSQVNELTLSQFAPGSGGPGRFCTTISTYNVLASAAKVSPAMTQHQLDERPATAFCDNLSEELNMNKHERIGLMASPDYAQYEKSNAIHRAKAINRRAKTFGQLGELSADDILTCGKRQEWKCQYCGVDCRWDYQVDHIIPLSKNGTNEPGNIAVSCRDCNYKKRDKLDYHPIQQQETPSRY